MVSREPVTEMTANERRLDRGHSGDLLGVEGTAVRSKSGTDLRRTDLGFGVTRRRTASRVYTGSRLVCGLRSVISS